MQQLAPILFLTLNLKLFSCLPCDQVLYKTSNKILCTRQKWKKNARQPARFVKKHWIIHPSKGCQHRMRSRPALHRFWRFYGIWGGLCWIVQLLRQQCVFRVHLCCLGEEDADGDLPSLQRALLHVSQSLRRDLGTSGRLWMLGRIPRRELMPWSQVIMDQM